MTEDRNKDRKGFTLAELLIVVAIIGVLVAISIPILNKQLEKSREAHDIYTMRAVADYAVDLYYTGKVNETEADDIGLKWWNGPTDDRDNAAGAYDPTTGTIKRLRDGITPYGKGTKTDTGTKYSMGSNPNTYKNNEDYTESVCMIAIYPNGNNKHIDVYWKNNTSKTNYVGGQDGENVPLYSFRIPLE